MQPRNPKIPPFARLRMIETLDWLIELADATGKPGEAKAWREEKSRMIALPVPGSTAAAVPGATPDAAVGAAAAARPVSRP